MTLPPLIRIFFAIELPELLREQINGLIHELKRRSRSHGIKWIKAENLHITLLFLAEVPSENLAILVQHIRTKLSQAIPSTVITLNKLQVFPSPYRPRVIVVDINPQEQLALIAKLLTQEANELHYQVDSRPFRAHLTLGRIKYSHGVNLAFLSDPIDLPKDAVNVKEVVLYRSEPQPEGSKYTVLERIELS